MGVYRNCTLRNARRIHRSQDAWRRSRVPMVPSIYGQQLSDHSEATRLGAFPWGLDRGAKPHARDLALTPSRGDLVGHDVMRQGKCLHGPYIMD